MHFCQRTTIPASQFNKKATAIIVPPFTRTLAEIPENTRIDLLLCVMQKYFGRNAEIIFKFLCHFQSDFAFA